MVRFANSKTEEFEGENRMPGINISVPHELSQDEALSRVKRLLGQVEAQFSDKISELQESWVGYVGTFSFSAMGFPVSGTFTVTASEVILQSTLPFAALPFKGKIESTIRERAAILLR